MSTKNKTNAKESIVKKLSEEAYLGAVIKRMEISVPEVDENNEIKAIDIDLKLSFNREDNGINLRGLSEFILKSCLDLEEYYTGEPIAFCSEFIKYKGKDYPRLVGSKGYIESILEKQ